MWISGTDWNAARIASHGSSGGFGGANATLFFARHGLLDEEALAKVRARTNCYASMVPQVPGQGRRCRDVTAG